MSSEKKDFSSSLLKDILAYRSWGEKWFEPFEKLVLMDQALLLTKWCLNPEEDQSFEFDKQDLKMRKEVYVKSYYFLFTTLALNVYSMVMLKRVSPYREYSLLQIFLLSNGLMTPFYGFLYYSMNQKYMDLKKHLTQKYLLQQN